MPPNMNKIDTLIGKTTHLKGDLEFCGGLHLDGRISGDVRADPSSNSTLSVSESGCIEGAVDVSTVILEGTVTGAIHARGRVVLGARSRVDGDVYYGVIEMALGAEIMGKLVPVTPGDPVVTGKAAKVGLKLGRAF
jgi:cytoskeletal protein CcmA (bactofilin family)